MVKQYKLLGFILILLSAQAEAKKSVDFDEVVYQTACYQAVPFSKEQASAQVKESDSEQIPTVILVNGSGKTNETRINLLTKAHRTKVSTPSRGLTLVNNQETVILLDKASPENGEDNNEEVNDSSEGNNETELFESITFTREILKREIPHSEELFAEVG